MSKAASSSFFGHEYSLSFSLTLVPQALVFPWDELLDLGLVTM
jgi:hypothetical protein